MGIRSLDPAKEEECWRVGGIKPRRAGLGDIVPPEGLKKKYMESRRTSKKVIFRRIYETYMV